MTEFPGRGIEVAGEGRRFVVVNKPAGMLAVPGKGADKADCAAARVAAMFERATGPLVVHRLDMDTSGLMVFGLDADAQRDLSQQFECRRVEKRYVALVDGRVEGEGGVIDVPMRLDPENRPMQVVDWDHGREAVTEWRLLSWETDRSRVELTPRTGRTHQLRVHCAYGGKEGMRGARGGEDGARGHPILGDVLYGPPWIDAADAERLMLHATWIRFTDPETGRRVEFESPAPF